MRSKDPSEPTRSQLLPFTTEWQTLTTKPYFLPGVLVAVMVGLLFSFKSQGDAVIQATYRGIPIGVPLYTVILSAGLIFAGIYAVYRMAGKPKAWWMMPLVAVFTALLLNAPLMGALQSVYGVVGDFSESDPFIVRFIKMFFLAGLPEESFKAVPVFIGVYIGSKLMGRLSATHPARQFAVLEPLDGILIGVAAGFGFAFTETVFQYVPKVIAIVPSTIVALQKLLISLHAAPNLPADILDGSKYGEGAWAAVIFKQLSLLVDRMGYERALLEFQIIIRNRQGVGLELMIPRLLSVVTGHGAYAGVMGYFIGLTVIRPAERLKTLATGLAIAASMHALWNSAATSTFNMMLIAGLAFFALAITISKARAISPERSQLVASQLVDRFSRSTVGSQPMPPRPQPQPYPQPQPQPQAPQQPLPHPYAPQPYTVAPAPVVTPPRPTLPPVPGGLMQPGGAFQPGADRPAGSITWDDDANLRTLEIGTARIPGTVGTRLYERQAPGLHASRGDGVVGEVTANPNDPTMLGLKNLSDTPWQVTLVDGAQRELQPGRNILIAAGMQIRMGELVARVR